MHCLSFAGIGNFFLTPATERVIYRHPWLGILPITTLWVVLVIWLMLLIVERFRVTPAAHSSSFVHFAQIRMTSMELLQAVTDRSKYVRVSQHGLFHVFATTQSLTMYITSIYCTCEAFNASHVPPVNNPGQPASPSHMDVYSEQFGDRFS